MFEYTTHLPSGPKIIKLINKDEPCHSKKNSVNIETFILYKKILIYKIAFILKGKKK